MLELRGQREGECMGVFVGVCLGVCVEGLGRSPARRRVSTLGEEGNRLCGRGIPDEEGPRGTDFTLTPPLIMTCTEKHSERYAYNELKS